MDGAWHHLCFLRLQVRFSTGNILRPTDQIRFFFPKGNIKLKTDFKKRQESAYFLISNFLSLQEGAALQRSCIRSSAAESSCLSQITCFGCYSLSSWLLSSALCIEDLPKRSPLSLFESLQTFCVQKRYSKSYRVRET